MVILAGRNELKEAFAMVCDAYSATIACQKLADISQRRHLSVLDIAPEGLGLPGRHYTLCFHQCYQLAH